MRRALAIFAIAMGSALALAASAPAYADPGDNGKGNSNPPANAGNNGNNGNAGNGNGGNGGNGGGASDNVGGNASGQDPPGFNGHIKVHDGDSEAEPIVRNEPHVGCTFHIHGFDFDVAADGTWDIQSWPPAGDRSTVLSGPWTSADGGNWRTALLSLSSGHYRVNADQTDPAAPGGEKHKMFWVECEAAAGGGQEEEEEEQQEQGEQGQQEQGEQGQQEQEQEEQGEQEGEAVAGVQQPPMVGGVSPTVESPAPGAQVGAQAGAQAGAQQAAQVAGQQAAPVTSLPSTSTEASSLLAALLAGAGLFLMRRIDR